MTRLGDERGQAAVEVVALLPLMLLLGVALMALLEARTAAEGAAAAAQAGAMALLQGEDANTAARAALPDRQATVRVEGRRVSVDVRPAVGLPFAAELLAGHATADAGPQATTADTGPQAGLATADAVPEAAP